jgi:CBS domain-containing protein
MKARHVMISPAVTVKPCASVSEVGNTILQRRISAVPVMHDLGGTGSDGDLMHRSEPPPVAIGRWRRLAFRGGRGAAPEPIPESDMATLRSNGA